MKTSVRLPCVCALALVALSGCTFINSLSWDPVSLPDAQDAFAACGAFDTEGWRNATTRFDNGSNPDYSRWTNAAGTVTWEGRYTNGGYPHIYLITAKGWLEPGTGYTFSGILKETYQASAAVTYEYDIGLSHATKPVEQVSGTLTYDGYWSGSLSFNNDTFTCSHLTE